MTEKIIPDVFSRPFNEKAFKTMHPGLFKQSPPPKTDVPTPPAAKTSGPGMSRNAIRPGDWKPPSHGEDI